MANTKGKAAQETKADAVEKNGLEYKVKFTSFPTESGVKGICTVTINGEFSVKGVKVIEGSKGLFMALPSYKAGDEYRDICHPVTSEGRKHLSDAVLQAYEIQSKEQMQNGQTQASNEIPELGFYSGESESSQAMN